jgi:hypothetical protein
LARSLFLDLVDSGQLRTKAELRSLYRHLVKKYHPDSRPEAPRPIDFDELKREYLAAAARLDAAASERDAARGAGRAFEYDGAAFVGELRDLVARGLPVGAKAVRRNKEYAKSIDYVSKCMDSLYGGRYGFVELNEQVKFLSERIPRAYWYVLQVLWSCFDCASGYAHGATIARRHLGCISHLLEELGYGKLDAFLAGTIDLSLAVKRKR